MQGKKIIESPAAYESNKLVVPAVLDAKKKSPKTMTAKRIKPNVARKTFDCRESLFIES